MAGSEPLRPGDIVIVPFPYADQLAEKRRPALVVSAEPFNARHGLAWVTMITSAANAHWDGDVTIADHAAAGLPAPSIIRTAMSPGIREQGDAFPLIADHTGKMIVGQFGSFIGGFLDNWEGTLEDGDMIFLSDPYSCAGAVSHSNDWLVLLPVFKDGRLIAYTSMFGHQSD
ncbi:MAG: hypothetical protein HC855_08780, partial [Rhizobiales bacterium]|nr:hypothetical protein [Hyphomicrobiales bacterium]